MAQHVGLMKRDNVENDSEADCGKGGKNTIETVDEVASSF